MQPLVAAGNVLVMLPSATGLTASKDLRHFDALNLAQIKHLARPFRPPPSAPQPISPHTLAVIQAEAAGTSLPLCFTPYSL